MNSFLKNYTSEVPVSQTIHRIEQVLIRCGVSGIMKEYTGTNGKIGAITFRIELPKQPAYTIRIPVDEKAVHEALWRDYAGADISADGLTCFARNKKKKKSDFKDQAERTAWKTMQDWIEVQMSIIQMRQAEFLQVFMPYVWDGSQTYYEAIKAGGFRALLPEKTGTD